MFIKGHPSLLLAKKNPLNTNVRQIAPVKFRRLLLRVISKVADILTRNKDVFPQFLQDLDKM